MKTLCAICKTREAVQKHHICYDPEITIDVCLECHKLIHNHGVGRGRGSPPLREEYRRISLKAEFIEYIEERIDCSIADFISEAVRLRLQALRSSRPDVGALEGIREVEEMAR